MASTCYSTSPLLLFTPQLHDTPTHTHIHIRLCARVLRSQRQRTGWMSSLLLASPPLIFDPAAQSHTYPTLLSPPLFFRFISPWLSLSLWFALFIASLILSVSICSLLILLISLRLSFSLRKSAADLPCSEMRLLPPAFSLSPPLPHVIQPSLTLRSLTLKYQQLFLNHSLVVSIPPSIPPSQAPLVGIPEWLTQIPSILSYSNQ